MKIAKITFKFWKFSQQIVFPTYLSKAEGEAQAAAPAAAGERARSQGRSERYRSKIVVNILAQNNK